MFIIFVSLLDSLNSNIGYAYVSFVIEIIYKLELKL